MTGWFAYRKHLFDHATVEELTRRLVAVLADAVARPDTPLSELPALA
ncbi:MAG: hypothetical protein IRY85_06810 [Micromonosporaceae bacterium]|nr:hypothetical protein [Micromonosporaceae bacterium]